MKKQYIYIDVMKIIFAILVVGIHSGIMQNTDSTIQWMLFHGIFRLAVPFFFVCSGFFLGIKLYKNTDTKDGIIQIKKYIKRLCIPFVFWLIIGLPMEIYELIGNGFIMIILKLLRKIIFYPWGALWYVLAVIIASIIIIPFYKRNKIEYAIILGAILYVFALLCNSYYFLIEKTVIKDIVDKYLGIFISARNGLFVGLFFVTIGIYIAKTINNDKRDFNVRFHTFLFIITYLLLLLEIFLIKNFKHQDDHSLFVMLPVFISELLIVVKRFDGNINTKTLRNYSTGIYFIHRPIINFFNIIQNELSIKINNYIVFILVLGIALVLLTICYKIDNKYLNRVIK